MIIVPITPCKVRGSELEIPNPAHTIVNWQEVCYLEGLCVQINIFNNLPTSAETFMERAMTILLLIRTTILEIFCVDLFKREFE